MLDDDFLARLSDAFPEFYARVDEEARAEAARLRDEAGGDVGKALARARMSGAARLWWPYVKGSVPVVGNDRAAMESFSRIVLTVDHLVGFAPAGMEGARIHVVEALRHSVDYGRLKALLTREKKEDAKAAAAGAGLMASVGALMSPITAFRSARRYIRFVPPPARVAIGAVVVGALASIPLVAGYSAGQQAEKGARQRLPGTNGAGEKSQMVDIDRAA